MSDNVKTTPPPNTDALKKQRDRFVAFAFSSADLFLEVSHEGRVTFALGAAKSITGIDHTTLTDTNWLELISPYEQTKIEAVFDNAKVGARCGPMIIQLSNAFGGQKAILTGIKMPNDSNIYISMGFSNALMEKLSVEMETIHDTPALLSQEHFAHSAQSIIRQMRDDNEEAYLSLLDLSELHTYEEKIDERLFKTLLSSIDGILLNASIYKSCAGYISNTHVGVVHNKTQTLQTILTPLKKALGAYSTGDDKAQNIDFKGITLECNLNSIEKNTSINALSQAFLAYKDVQKTYPYETLQDALDAYKKTTKTRLKTLNNAIKRLGFDMAYQQVNAVHIADAPNGSNEKPDHHYEILCRFEDQTPTPQWISFIEEQSQETVFDQAMLELVLNYIGFKGGETQKIFSMNIFSKSLLDKKFQKKLNDMVKKHPNAPRRLYLEIKNAEHIENISKTSSFINDIKAKGFGIILDDISPLNTNLKRLLTLRPDFIKTSIVSPEFFGKTAPDILNVLQNFAQQCKSLELKFGIKHIHSHTFKTIALNAGADFIQGKSIASPNKKPILTSTDIS